MPHIPLLWLILFVALGCGEGSGSQILLVVNRESPISLAIGNYYAGVRGVPDSHILALEIPLDDPTLAAGSHETISREDYESQIRDPIEAHLRDHDLIDRIEIIVVTKGIPLRVDDFTGPMKTWLRDTRQAAVDAELSLLFSQVAGSAGVQGSINPYFGARHSFAAFREKHPDSPLRYLVARLTGYTGEIDPETGVPLDIKAMIDSASATLPEHEKPGVWLIDLNPNLGTDLGVANLVMLEPAISKLEGMGIEVVADRAAHFASDVDRISGYASWGSNDENDPGPPYYGDIDGKRYPGHFLPRAIASDFVSTNARSFTAPVAYGQSLLADLIRLGVSGASGHVYEPALSGVARPQILLPAYARGIKAVEAFYRSIPYLSWMNVYIGDPLMTVEHPIEAKTGDRDFDGVPDSSDNCLDIPNPNQRDTNADGFGNLCDADIDGDGVVTTSWGTVYPLTQRGDIEWIALSAQNGPYDPNYDLDGDGDVDAGDLSIAQMSLFRAPGPSAQAR